MADSLVWPLPDGASTDFAVPFPSMDQGPLRPLTPEEKAKDERGFTHPNLHRRIADGEHYKAPGEYKSRKYTIRLQGVCSYRTTEKFVHSDDNIEDELP